mmetsp:Transcript_10934/g.20428  ORF Transcript_10934/g.20428 Transcript_10934/m.20428 type:complete len:176 (-) Transcript_10934:3061-3588(-)
MNREEGKEIKEQKMFHPDGSQVSNAAAEEEPVSRCLTFNQGAMNQNDKNDVPEEEQCQQVDMNDENLDPLEWSVRKMIPIPKKYYFETGNYDVPLRTKAWHRSVQVMGLALLGVEKIGGFFANVLGLTSSRYDDVLAYMTKEELEEARENARLDRQKRLARLEENEKNNYKIEVV